MADSLLTLKELPAGEGISTVWQAVPGCNLLCHPIANMIVGHMETGHKCEQAPKHPDHDHMTGGAVQHFMMTRSALQAIEYPFQGRHNFKQLNN